MLAVDAGGVMATTNANSSSLILAFRIKTLPFGLYLWVKITLIGMAKTLSIIKICDARAYSLLPIIVCTKNTSAWHLSVVLITYNSKEKFSCFPKKVIGDQNNNWNSTLSVLRFFVHFQSISLLHFTFKRKLVKWESFIVNIAISRKISRVGIQYLN